MTKVLTFIRIFPAYHPKAGQRTYFLEKLLKGFPDYSAEAFTLTKDNRINDLFPSFPLATDHWESFQPKYHTIRTGRDWQAGDMFIPRVWTGQAHLSDQITIAPDIRIEKVWDFEIKSVESLHATGKVHTSAWIDNKPVPEKMYFEIAKNDGLDYVDLVDWLQPNNKPPGFSGQIICWNKNLDY
jgi:hypothetical protein